MALLWIDGFEKYGPSGGTILPTDILDWKYVGHYDERIDIVSGRSGNAIRIDNTATNLVTPSLKTPGSTDNTLIVGFAFQMSALTNTQRMEGVQALRSTYIAVTHCWIRQRLRTCNSTLGIILR
jgi:hypothetical protein